MMSTPPNWRFATTSTGWFSGLQLHLVLGDHSEIMAFKMTFGNRDDGAVVEKRTHTRKGMKKQILPPFKRWLLSKRKIIETVIAQFKCCHIQHTRH